MDAVRNGFNERLEERYGGLHVCLFDEFHHSELRGAVDGYEQVERAFRSSYLCQVDVEEADRIGVELLPLGLVTFDVRQPTDAVTLQTPMKGRAGELRNRSLKSVEAIVQRQQRVLAKRHDDGLLFDGKNGRPGYGWAGSAVRLVESGQTLAAAARSLGVVEQTLGNWIKLHRAGTLKGVSGKSAVTAEQMEISRLRAELARVTMERDILGKATAFFAKGQK